MRDHLRAQQETLSSFILNGVVGRGRRPSAELSRWLNSTSRPALAATSRQPGAHQQDGQGFAEAADHRTLSRNKAAPKVKPGLRSAADAVRLARALDALQLSGT